MLVDLRANRGDGLTAVAQLALDDAAICVNKHGAEGDAVPLRDERSASARRR
jgi:hypothetical protein